MVDLNCDLGEGASDDEEILDIVTSANIACGLHAGDPSTMRKTVALALKKGVAVGAHPGLADRAGFGRREANLSPEQACDLVVYQTGALAAFVKAEGGTLRHVKPHGALYTMAAGSRALADAVAKAVHTLDPQLILFGLSGSELVRAGERIGLRVASEAFADRTYRSDGSLTPRREPDALVGDPDRSLKQAVRLAKEGRVTSLQGVDVSVRADTICVHGDAPHAAALARRIREALEAAGVSVRAPGRA